LLEKQTISYRDSAQYESGDLLPSRAISSALILLDHDPKALTVLRRTQSRPVTTHNELRP
jgi:HTH-type transcriptional regulator/antitoxin MqsA